MHPAHGSVTEGFLTQIASHTFRGYVSALGSPERRAPRWPSVAESSESTSRTTSARANARSSDPIGPADEPGSRARAKLVRREGIEPSTY